MVDKFVVFGRNVADPWNRISCCTRPILLFVEFCQALGPKSIFYFPERIVNEHLSFEDVALSLMSSDNLHGTYSCTFNQQIGAYTLVQYGTLLDISARAFQRSFAIAYITPKAPNTVLQRRFQILCIRALRPILVCNRHYFQSIAERIFLIAEHPDQSEIKGFYTDQKSIALLNNRIKCIAQQVRPLHKQLVNAEQNSGVYSSNNNETFMNCICDCNSSDLEKFAPLFVQRLSIQLIPLLELAPCFGGQFKTMLNGVYIELGKCCNTRPTGLLFSANSAIIRSFFGANSQMPTTRTEHEDDDKREEDSGSGGNAAQTQSASINRQQKDVNTLKMISHRMIRCLYPLLSGDRLIVLASQRRKLFADDLLNKLDMIYPQKTSELINWHLFDEGSETTPIHEMLPNERLTGLLCDRETSHGLFAKQQNKSMVEAVVVVDLNNRRIRCREYTGKLLSRLVGKKSAFPSDRALLDFTAAILSDIGQLVVLAKYTSPHTLIRQLKLDVADRIILCNLLVELNIAKYSQLKLEIAAKEKFIPLKVFHV